MKWAPKLGMAVALLAGVIAAVYLVWSIGFDAVAASIARAGFGGLALLCLYALIVFVSLAFASLISNSDVPHSSYARVFPVCTVAKIVLAQLLVTWRG